MLKLSNLERFVMKKLNSKGFSGAEALLIIIIIAIIGGVAYYVYQANRDIDKNLDRAATSQNQPQKADQMTKTEEAKLQSFSFASELDGKQYTVDLKYPEGWTATKGEAGDKIPAYLVRNYAEKENRINFSQISFGTSEENVSSKDNAVTLGDYKYTKKVFSYTDSGKVFFISYINEYSAPFKNITVSLNGSNSENAISDIEQILSTVTVK